MKFRPVTRSRSVTDHIDGEDVTYDEAYTEMIPKIPFNLDATLRKALFAVAVLMTAGAIVWGTVAIGSMLALLAPQWAAYLVAGCFDLAWAACLAAEYINRYDADKAKLPRDAGIAALALSMGAIMWHGNIEGALIVGIVGAAVSLVSKGVWFIAMQAVTVRLDKPHQMLLRKRQQDAGLKLALAQSRRDQIIADDRTARLLASMEFGRGANITVEQIEDAPDASPTHHDAIADASPASTDAPQVSALALAPTGTTKTEKILSAASLLPKDAPHAEVAHLLAQHGCAVDTAYVRTVLSRERKKNEIKTDNGTGQYL